MSHSSRFSIWQIVIGVGGLLMMAGALARLTTTPSVLGWSRADVASQTGTTYLQYIEISRTVPVRLDPHWLAAVAAAPPDVPVPGIVQFLPPTFDSPGRAQLAAVGVAFYSGANGRGLWAGSRPPPSRGYKNYIRLGKCITLAFLTQKLACPRTSGKWQTAPPRNPSR